MQEEEKIIIQGQNDGMQSTSEAQDNKQQANTKVNTAKQSETTYDDLFLSMGSKIKNQEAFAKLKDGYSKQLASTISGKKVEDVRLSLLEEYADLNAEFLAEQKVEAKLQEKIQQNNLEVKSFLEKNGLSELTDEELEEAINYGVLKDIGDKEKAKTNPAIAKMIKEATTIAKAKSKPMPKAATGVMTEDILLANRKRLDQYLIKQRTQKLTPAENKDFNELSKILLQYQ